jgi:hypothetical protein
VVVYAPVAIAVHDHVHFAGARHAVIGVAAVDAAVSQMPEARVFVGLVDGGATLLVLLAEFLGPLGLAELLLVERGHELGVVTVHVLEDLLADDLEEADEETAGATGRIADDFVLLGLDHADHELDNRAGREELPDLAAEGAAEKSLERDALHVFAGVGEVVAFEEADDFSSGVGLQVDAVVVGEELVVGERGLGLVEQIIDRVVA